jgi:ADP-heptose:LPS heptosyltransferase
VNLAGQVARSTGMRCVIVGGPAEAPIAEKLLDALNVSGKTLFEDWTARGTVADLWPVFRGARFTLTNESGLAHVAALCGSFVQIVCGAADPRRTRPLGPGRVQVAINPVECWPCERNVCTQPPTKYIQCLRGIAPETVWEEIQRASSRA